MTMLLILLLVAVAVVLLLRRPRPGREPMQPSYYARDDAFGRRDPTWQPSGMAAPQEGMGSSIARGVATGLAVGAGAAIAEEMMHRSFQHGRDTQGSMPEPGHARVQDQSHSDLARDAGIGAFDPSADAQQGFADFDDGGWSDGGGADDQGGWDA